MYDIIKDKTKKGIVMNVKSKKKQRTQRDNGFIRIDAIYSKKKKRDSQANNFFNFNLKKTFL